MDNCFYCEKDAKLNELMVHICDLSFSSIYLVKNQNFSGRCVVACKEHKTELFQLNEQQLIDFSKDAALVSQAIYDLFKADKINYGIFGDGVPHLHYHIVPKKKGEFCWGGQFEMNGNPQYLSDEALSQRVELLRTEIQKLRDR